MHVLPPLEALRDLVGAELTQIILDPFGISFYLSSTNFEGTITSTYRFAFGGADTARHYAIGEQGTRSFGPNEFQRLLLSKITSLDLTDDALELSISFSTGERLTIYSELDGNESGTMSLNGPASRDFWVF